MREPVSRRTALVAAGAAGALLVPGVARSATVSKFPFPTTSTLRVLVTGDAGTGSAAQYAVTKAARRLFATQRLSLALGLGDNIYENGPEAPDDDEFAAKFETPNAGLDVPWLMALGNHDNSLLIPGDGSWLERGNHEVGYHSRSPRWWMPSRYYSVSLPKANPIVEFLVLDLNPLCAYIPQLLGYWAPNGPYMTAQREWLRRRLSTSKARWKVVCNHFPYLSNGSHGNAGSYDGVPFFLPHANGTYVKELFEQDILGRAQFILCGHDHSQQLLKPSTATKGTIPIVSGAAGKTSGGGGTNPAYFQQFDALGFTVLDISASTVSARVYSVDPSTSRATLAYRRTLAG